MITLAFLRVRFSKGVPLCEIFLVWRMGDTHREMPNKDKDRERESERKPKKEDER